jgi:hypothetical protein
MVFMKYNFLMSETELSGAQNYKHDYRQEYP